MKQKKLLFSFKSILFSITILFIHAYHASSFQTADEFNSSRKNTPVHSVPLKFKILDDSISIKPKEIKKEGVQRGNSSSSSSKLTTKKRKKSKKPIEIFNVHQDKGITKEVIISYIPAFTSKGQITHLLRYIIKQEKINKRLNKDFGYGLYLKNLKSTVSSNDVLKILRQLKHRLLLLSYLEKNPKILSFDLSELKVEKERILQEIHLVITFFNKISIQQASLMSKF